MRIDHVVSAAMIGFVTCGTTALADPAFFPVRPSGGLSTIQGALTTYGHGNELGGFTIKDGKGVNHVFYMGTNMQIDGKRIYCGFPPTATFKPDTTVVCPDWPTNVTVGHAIVKAVYWNTTYQGQAVQASDFITVVTP